MPNDGFFRFATLEGQFANALKGSKNAAIRTYAGSGGVKRPA